MTQITLHGSNEYFENFERKGFLAYELGINGLGRKATVKKPTIVPPHFLFNRRAETVHIDFELGKPIPRLAFRTPAHCPRSNQKFDAKFRTDNPVKFLEINCEDGWVSLTQNGKDNPKNWPHRVAQFSPTDIENYLNRFSFYMYPALEDNFDWCDDNFFGHVDTNGYDKWEKNLIEWEIFFDLKNKERNNTPSPIFDAETSLYNQTYCKMSAKIFDAMVREPSIMQVRWAQNLLVMKYLWLATKIHHAAKDFWSEIEVQTEELAAKTNSLIGE